MNNYLDSLHYITETVTLILNRILSFQPQTILDDFGVYLTPKNIEYRLNQICADKQVWQ